MHDKMAQSQLMIQMLLRGPGQPNDNSEERQSRAEDQVAEILVFAFHLTSGITRQNSVDFIR